MDPRDSARKLRQKLNDHAVDILQLANNAAELFSLVGSVAHARWLALEQNGYGTVHGSASVPEALGLEPSERLAVHVFAYRVQTGETLATHDVAARPFRHFFVEPLSELVASAKRIRAGAHASLTLHFAPSVPDYPAAAMFPVSVFDDVLLGFRATLHLQLGTIGA
jgi:hypothetical protein